MPWKLPLTHPVYTVFGANTGVGKTIISALMVKAMAPEITYIKPVSTGPMNEADYLHIDRYTGITGKVLYQFQTPCSPHLAAGPDPPRDSIITQRLLQLLQEAQHPVIVETAGGPHSPSPAGTSQLELYRPLRLPTVLVADSNLGGISTTVSALESLRLHGYDVAAIVGFRSSWGNLDYLKSKFSSIPTIQIPAPPERRENEQEDTEHMSVYYDMVSQSRAMGNLTSLLGALHKKRLERLNEMPKLALQKLWYPFTQHAHLTPSTITVIDSALEDDFSSYKAAECSLQPVFDGSASWWTQGLGHGNTELALEAAYASSRYGHVILPNAVNEPALALAEELLRTVGKGWASRVYYSDNGATGIEIALKMALKAARVRYQDTKEVLKLGIIGYKGSYHGDTIGAMDASDPNIYNEEVDWYDARGLFFDPPSVQLQKGRWTIRAAFCENEELNSLQDVFDLPHRLQSSTAAAYIDHIRRSLRTALENGQRFGGLLFEPILLGAGGMVFVDPLFQHLLVKVVRESKAMCPDTPDVPSWTGLPVITDEVFTGLYRLSVPRAASLLNIDPDINVNAKLLTGGAIPLAVTLATEDIFNVFLKDEKKDCLLHGHSYTAHPMGTSVALKSIARLQEMHDSNAVELSPAAKVIKAARQDWQGEPIHSIWSHDFVQKLSYHKKVDGVVCLGSVLAITLRVEAQDSGYNSMAAGQILQHLRVGTGDLGGILARPLGNVLYFMASQITTRDTAQRVETLLMASLQ